MVFRLAGHLGAHVPEVEEYDLFHLQEWAAFYEIEPWGVDWWLLARLLQTLQNALRSKGAPPVKLSDVLPIPEQEQTQEEMISFLKRLSPG